MHKNFDSKLLFLLAAIAVIAIEITIVSIIVNSLNVLAYLFAVEIFPALALFFFSLLYGLFTASKRSFMFAAVFICAITSSIIMFLFCGAVITPEVVERMIANSETNGAIVSINTASTGDNIQSVLLFVAFAGLGVLIGDRIKSKRKKVSTTLIDEEYD